MKQTQQEWQTVFIIFSCMSAIGGIVYLLLCDGNLQPWAISKQTDEKDEVQKIGEDAEYRYTRF